jgi:hypothetical protein
MRSGQLEGWLFRRMTGRADPPVPTAVGAAVGLAGLAFAAVGLWARRDVARALARERIVDTSGSEHVASAGGARAMAETIRRNTIETTRGRTYAEIDAYLDPEGTPTPDRGRAARDERTGQPVANPDHALWIESTTLQAALMQAYVAFRLSELTVGIGASFVAAGIGIAAGGRRCGRQ